MIDQYERKALKDAPALKEMSFIIFNKDRKPKQGICAEAVTIKALFY
jgi:hypothetical protein